MVWFWLYNTGLQRDYARLERLKILQDRLTNYYANFNTYQMGGCNKGMAINLCKGVGIEVIYLADIIDPTNSEDYRFVVNSLTSDNYAIAFSFERKIGNLLPGNHVLTKIGIK